MADGELFAAMHDVGLAEFVAKGLDKKHRKPLPPLGPIPRPRIELRNAEKGNLSRHLWESSNDIYDIFKLCWAAREPRRVSPHSIFPRLVRERNNEY